MIREVRQFALLLVLFAPALAAQEWESQYDEDGVLVQTRDVEGSRYQAFRASTRLPVAPSAVLARLRDIDRYPEWFPDTLEARAVTAQDGTWANYIRTDAPWPVKDRDAIYRNRLIEEDGFLRIEIEADAEALPVEKDAVRVSQAKGYWELRAVDGGTQATWEFHLEPGGSISPGLANARVVNTPQRALQALREYFSTP